MTLTIADQPSILSLCTGYGGLTRAVETVTGGRTVAVADIESGPRKVLAHRFPGIPNLGDITTVDWRDWVGKVDVIDGGTPCQDVSLAGQRKGMHDGTRSNLWVAMRDAIAVIRPRLVVWENVGGAYSACAASDLGCCPRCVGETEAGRHSPVLRALGRVLGDLSALGYDAQWLGIRAADAGAPHRRLRVFVTAHPAGERHEWAGGARDGWTGPADGGGGPLKLLPTPVARDAKGMPSPGRSRASLPREISLLPTPRASDGTHGGPNQRGSKGDLALPSAVALLPTPRAARGGSATETMALLPTSAGVGIRPSLDTLGADPGRWGKYAAAIARWEAILGRPAPEPTEPAPRGGRRLSARFEEWMMGCPDGWVTNTPGVGRQEAMRMLGNGVVERQATAALRHLLTVADTMGAA